MTSPKPHFLLFCDGNVSASGEGAGSQRGRWRFVLEDLVSGAKTEATDQENACAPDRSALISVLRGLEALEQPSRVTLVTTSRYVSRGLQYGLTEWRDNDYSWEHFGTVQPIRNADIWKRIDRALAYHQVQCRWMAQEGAAEPADETSSKPNTIRSSDQYAGSISENASERLVESIKTTNVKTAHRRSRFVDGNRTKVSVGNYQRVYIDSPPNSQVPALCSDSTQIQMNSDPVSGMDASRIRMKNSGEFNSRFGLFFHNATFPLRLLFRGPIWLCSHFWEAILVLDEWLESFLRCLLLLDPSKRPTRR